MNENPPTEMQKKIANAGGPLDNSPPLVSGQTREILPPYADQYWLSEADKKEMGIRPDRAYSWIRNDRFWEEYEGSSRIHDYSREHPGLEIPQDARKAHRTAKDLLLVSYPMEQKEEADREAERAMKEWLGEIDSGEHGVPRDGDGVPVDDRAYMKAKARRMHEANKRTGITGNTVTSGLSLEQAWARYSDAEILAEEARYRAGGRRQSFDSDDWAAFLDGGKGPPGQRKERGKVHAMGDAGLGRRPLNISQKQGGLKNQPPQAQPTRRGG